MRFSPGDLVQIPWNGGRVVGVVRKNRRRGPTGFEYKVKWERTLPFVIGSRWMREDELLPKKTEV
jgi:hypothetical protein